MLEVSLEYPKELHEFHNDYLLAPDRLEIKKALSDYQLKIFDEYLISIDNVKKLVSNFFSKVCASLQKLATLFKYRIKNEKGTSSIGI